MSKHAPPTRAVGGGLQGELPYPQVVAEDASLIFAQRVFGPRIANGVQGRDGAAGAAAASFPDVGATWVSTLPLVVPINNVPVYIKRAKTIVGVSLLTNGGVGSCVVDIWKTPVGSYPPTVANSICAAALPTIIGGRAYVDTTLTGWTTAVAAGDTLVFSLVSSATFTLIAARLHFSE